MGDSTGRDREDLKFVIIDPQIRTNLEGPQTFVLSDSDISSF